MELGLGIHGEPGACKGPLKPVDEIVAQVRDLPPVLHGFSTVSKPVDEIVAQVGIPLPPCCIPSAHDFQACVCPKTHERVCRHKLTAAQSDPDGERAVGDDAGAGQDPVPRDGLPERPARRQGGAAGQLTGLFDAH